MLVTSLSNAGIALVYAGIGEYLHVQTSFIAALAASIAVPAAAWGLAVFFKRLRRAKSVPVSGADEIRPAFNVDFSYPVCFTRDVLAPQNPTLARILNSSAQNAVKVFFIVDRGVVETHPEFECAI